MRGLSANVLCGQRGHFGTNAFDVLLDASKLGELNASADIDTVNNEALIEEAFVGLEDPDSACSQEKLSINQNADAVGRRDTGQVPQDYVLDF